MRWIAPSVRDASTDILEKRLWEAADEFRANSGLTSQQYSQPVLGLIFLRFAEARFAAQRAKLEKQASSTRRGSRLDDPAAYHAEGVIYLTPSSRFDHLLTLPEGSNVGTKLNEAMADVEKHNPQLAGVLPRTYQIFNSTLLKELLKKVSEIPGLCKAATLAEIEAQGWSLNPGRYVGVAPGEEISDEDFKEKLEELNEEFETLNAQARELEATIAKNVAEILES